MSPPIYHVGTKSCPGVENLIVSEIVALPCELSFVGIDALIITSANALAVLDNITQEWRSLPAFVIGEASAKAVQKCGGIVEFVSKDSHGDGFFKELKGLAQGRTLLYPRAKEIRSHIGERLQNAGIRVIEAIVYENRPLKLLPEQKPPKGAILIFSAPSAYRHFLENFPWDESYKAVAIGRTTLKCFAPNVRAYLAPSVSLEGCLQKAYALQKEL